MRIFAVVRWGETSKDSGVVEERNFRRLLLAMLGNFRQDMQEYNYIGLQDYTALRRLFSGPQMHDLE